MSCSSHFHKLLSKCFIGWKLIHIMLHEMFPVPGIKPALTRRRNEFDNKATNLSIIISLQIQTQALGI